MPQGLCNAPATFQRAMDVILDNLKLSCVLVYLDDINVFSQTFGDHLEHLEEVFRQLLKANLKLKRFKCQFFKEQLDYLGFVVDKDRLHPQIDKVKAIKQMSTPTTERDIQAFFRYGWLLLAICSEICKYGRTTFSLVKK